MKAKYRNTPSKYGPYFHIFGWAFLFLLSLQVKGQDEVRIRDILDKKDLQKVQKADGFRENADALNAEANRLYQEVFAVQADPDLSESQISKKVDKLESSALKNQEKASSLYEKANEIRFITYQKYLDRFWSSAEGEDPAYENERLIGEQADESYFQAVNYRVDAQGISEGSARVEMLTQADELENTAIEKQLTALAVCYGIQTAPEPNAADALAPATANMDDRIPSGGDIGETATPSRSATVGEQEGRVTEPSQIEVNQEMIDMYRRYLESGQYLDSTVLTSEMTGVTSFDRDRILDLWYRYRYGDMAALLSEAAPEDSASDTSPVPQDEMTGTEKAAGTFMAETPSPEAGETELGIVTEENKAAIVLADEEVIYRVQISANRTELSQRALSNIYYGNKMVEMILEDGWYKYSVGDFATYNEASDFRNSIGMNNAFVVAYRKGTSFRPVTQQEVVVPDMSPSDVHAGMPPGLLFRVQIAANRVPSSIAQVGRIYSGSLPLEEVREEGWYKYQLLGVRLYADALRLLDEMKVEGAFVVAYNDGVKQVLSKAVAESRELERTVQTYGRRGYVNEIEFHVQLAATRSAVREEDLARLYAGPEPVALIFEDGWYKYRIKTGNSYEDALRIKQDCGIRDAFVVAYRRASRITLAEALQE